MKLQAKIVFTLLLVSFLATGTVGIVAYSFLMYDFRQTARNNAFENFQEDITEYLTIYGTLEAGEAREPFERFVERRRVPPIQPQGENTKLRPGRPPFRFLVLDPQGRALRSGLPNFQVGEMVSADIFKQSQPIEVNGKTVVRLVQIGAPVLTATDHAFLLVMKQALLIGIGTAGVISILMGLFLGKKLIITLDDLTQAVRKIKLDCELQGEVEIRSNDEIGELAKAFNVMNGELRRSHAELRELTLRDPLTGLFNRRYFDDQAKNLYHQACRYKHPMSVIIGDLDHFKQINDHFTHAVGDEVLVRVAEILQSGIRQSDLVARYGGEEFVLLFPETTFGDAMQICEKLRCAIESYPWWEVVLGLKVTISMGLCSDLSRGNFEKMLVAADKQLYQAKEEGRNLIMPLSA